MKTHQWLTLIAAVLITLGEVLVFNRQANAAAATDLGSGGQTRASPAEPAAIYSVSAASGTRSSGRVR